MEPDVEQYLTDIYLRLLKVEKVLGLKQNKDYKKDSIENIFDHWNRQKDTGRWKSHGKLTPDIQQAIIENLRRWPVEDINQAISNFAMVLQGREYLWTYDKWGLREFLSRTDKEDRKVRRWWRFHPNNFRPEDWLTDQARQERFKKQRGEEKHRQEMQEYIKYHGDWIMSVDADILRERCLKDSKMNCAVKQLRPQIFK